MKVNQDFAKSLSSFSGNQQTDDENELELLLQDETPPKEAKNEEKSEKPKKSLIRIDKLQEETPETMTATLTELYTAEEDSEQHIEEDDSNIFDDKEIYDIMEIDNSYVEDTGTAILNDLDEENDEDDDDDDDESEFILINYKSSDDLSTEKEQQFIVEEMYSSAQENDNEKSSSTASGTRKKHLKRMPRELVERYAQSTDNNQHICTKCVKVFSTRTNLIRHIQSHDGNKVRFLTNYRRIFN